MRLRYIDWILVFAFLVAGFAIGYRFLFDFGVTDFQEWMLATVTWACGHGASSRGPAGTGHRHDPPVIGRLWALPSRPADPFLGGPCSLGRK